MRVARFLISTLLALAPFLATALDAPHDPSSPSASQGCAGCHKGHDAGNAGLTDNRYGVGITNLCLGCHSGGGHGFPWTLSDPAIPGTSGISHAWNAVSNNLGATPPPAPMGSYLDTGGGAPGRLTCAVCHDPHSKQTQVGGTRYTSVALNTPIAHTGSGTLVLTTVPSNAAAKGYVIKISAATAFKISHDNGISYLGYSSTANPKWGSDTAAPYLSGKTFVSGTSVTLDDELTQVTFTGTFTISDVFARFYVGYPFIRISNADSAMCIVCHANRNMNHTRVAGNDGTYPANGTNVFSHPVGVSLNANGKGYDRGDAVTNNVLDANGVVQTTGDGVSSNNLRLGTNNAVHCMSCHSPHLADSNSLTELP